MLGAVLTGGASTRMGHDKALLAIDGVAMAARVAAAMRGAGATEVMAVGGDQSALEGLGLRYLADASPGAGPLGALVTALRAASAAETLVVTAPCDMPWIETAHVATLVDGLTRARASARPAGPLPHVAVAGDQHLFAAWRPSALTLLEVAFASGERSPRRALANLPEGAVAAVALPTGPWSRDVDSSADLP